MDYHPIENLLPKSGFSIYRLVRMAANRATELSEGKPKLIEETHSDKETTIALQEILAGKIEYKGIAKNSNNKPKAKATDEVDSEEKE